MKTRAYIYKTLRSSGSYSANYYTTDIAFKRPDPEFYEDIIELVSRQEAETEITRLTKERSDLVLEVEILVRQRDELYKALLLHRPKHKDNCVCTTCQALASVKGGAT